MKIRKVTVWKHRYGRLFQASSLQVRLWLTSHYLAHSLSPFFGGFLTHNDRQHWSPSTEERMLGWRKTLNANAGGDVEELKFPELVMRPLIGASFVGEHVRF